jgi:hypothetical protein
MGDTEDPVLQAQIDKLVEQLGADFKAAWEALEEADETTPDGQALNAALDELSEKCPG